MKSFTQMQADYINNNYKEHRGILVKKYRNLFGQYVFIIDEKGIRVKIYVGKTIFKDIELGTKWTIGEIDRKLINIRPGFCENTDE